MPGVALDVEAAADYPIGRGKCAVGVADTDVERASQVVWQLRVQNWRAELDRCLGVGHRLQRVVADDDRRHAVLGSRSRVGDDRRDRLAHIAHRAVGQDGLAARTQRRVGHRGMDASLAEVGGAQDGHHARHLARRGEVHVGDARVRLVAAHERDVELPRQIKVLDEGGLSAQQARVFESPNRGADEGHCGECMLIAACARSKARSRW